jgi:ribosome-binding protein aMBF1 (putative translation factor)
LKNMREQEQIGNRRHGLSDTRGAEGNPPPTALPQRRSSGRTQDIDRYVGARIRERRIMLGLTQQQLADLIGVTYQQAHNTNAVSTAYRPADCSRSPKF